VGSRVINQHDLYPADWKYIAWKIKDRAGWKCEGCKMPRGPASRALGTHHVDLNPQNNSDENLIALCRRCHLKVHGMMQQPRTRLEVIQRLKEAKRQLYFR